MSDGYHLRKAKDTDINLLFDWVNDPLTRQNSFHSETIPWEEHRTWFQNVLENPKQQIYIYCNLEQPIGQVRIDISNDGFEAKVSYSIAKEYRGFGYGKRMLSLLSKQVKIDFPDIRKFVAEVKPENIASQRCFLDLGYNEMYRVYEFDLNSRNF